MKFITTYQRTLRTSRRFVFENIFDLEHVCVVHRRWFRNLRVLVQHPEYVEYRLTSLFYGLRQETLARGARIDENRYWYEFITPLARGFIGAAAGFGTTRGGVMVRIAGRDSDGAEAEEAICVYAAERGEMIPAILPSLAAQMILNGELRTLGIVRHTDWVAMDQLEHELARRGIRLVVRESEASPWAPITAKAVVR